MLGVSKKDDGPRIEKVYMYQLETEPNIATMVQFLVLEIPKKLFSERFRSEPSNSGIFPKKTVFFKNMTFFIEFVCDFVYM